MITSRRSFILGTVSLLAAPAIVRVESIMPVRSLRLAPPVGANLPYGLVPCDGRLVSRALYPKLFAVIGTRYGAGNGSTTFNLPNYQPTRPEPPPHGPRNVSVAWAISTGDTPSIPAGSVLPMLG